MKYGAENYLTLPWRGLISYLCRLGPIIVPSTVGLVRNRTLGTLGVTHYHVFIIHRLLDLSWPNDLTNWAGKLPLGTIW
jgi:hypothetical protein